MPLLVSLDTILLSCLIFPGTSVLTRYNNKTYKIDDLDFDSSPSSTFKNSDGKDVSYFEYYKNQYNIDIKARAS